MAEAIKKTTKPEQVIVASKEDLFLKEIMAEAANEPEVWKALDMVFDEEYQDLFELPPELRTGNPKQAPQARERAYVWVEIDDQRMARTYYKANFIPVNRVNHAFLPDSYFNFEGAIMRHGTSRHILFYQPRDFNDKMKMAISMRYADRKKEVDQKLEKGGAVSLEVVTKEGGYGETPLDAPVQRGWKGEAIKEESDTFDYTEESKRTEDSES